MPHAILWLVVSLTAFAEPPADWKPFLASAETRPACEGPQFFSDAVLPKLSVPEGCPKTKAYLRAAAKFDELVRSDCRPVSSMVYDRLRAAASCHEVVFSEREVEEIRNRMLRERLQAEGLRFRKFGKLESPLCKASFEHVQWYVEKLHSLATHHFRAMDYAVNAACDDPGYHEYVDMVERGGY